MSRKTIPIKIQRKLWSQCAGYCQNPTCTRNLFQDFEDETVHLGQIAHIIGSGKNGPRSEHELASYIDKNGISNLLMLCLVCHRTVDVLEKKFPVEKMLTWKSNHLEKIDAIFTIPNVHDENELLKEINDLLDENRLIFMEYGPFSKKAIEGDSGDVQKIWRRRCLDTILPNNNRIIGLVEKNRHNFSYPWALYNQIQSFKIHADSFRDNCLLNEKINDYKLFPLEFDYYVKIRLGIDVKTMAVRENEELEYRSKTIDYYMREILASHSFIEKMEKLDIAILMVSLKDGSNLRVFVTNTYHFTDYTFEKILTIDPNIDAIICSNPYSTYSDSAKWQCIHREIGLFMLREFMGAIRHKGDRFLNYLLSGDRSYRINHFSSILKNNSILRGECRVYLFGSFLRHSLYQDIDIILVYKNGISSILINSLQTAVIDSFHPHYSLKFDFLICSEYEFSNMVLDYDNKIKIF